MNKKMNILHNNDRNQQIGPEKRSAFVYDYVELESQLAKSNQQIQLLHNIIKELKSKQTSNSKLFNSEEIKQIKEYIEARDLAFSLREKNNKDSINHSRDGASYKHFTPINVTDAFLDLSKKSILVGNMVARKIGLK